MGLSFIQKYPKIKFEIVKGGQMELEIISDLAEEKKKEKVTYI